MSQVTKDEPPAKGIWLKINRIMELCHGVEKGDYNAHSKYKYTGHEAVTAALRDHYVAVGIVRSADMTDCQVLDGGVIMVWVNVEFVDIDTGETIVRRMAAVQPSQTTNKSVTAQQIGQAVSYAVKNVEFKLFSLTGDPDPDSDGVDDRPPPPPPPAQRRPADNRTDQQRNHDKAEELGEISIWYGEREQEGYATGKEAAHALIERLRDKEMTFEHAARILANNYDFIQRLPETWRTRICDVADSKPKSKR